MKVAIGVDIGGSGIRAVWVSDDGAVGSVQEVELLASEMTVSDLVAVIQQLVRDIELPATAEAGGLAVPAFVDARENVLNSLTIPSLESESFMPAAARALSSGGRSALRVIPIVDASAAAYGEYRLGLGRNSSRFMCVAIGTGVNIGVVLEGIPLIPTLGSLGDGGHIQVGLSTSLCPCGGSGCLETVLSGRSLGARAQELGFVDLAELADAAREGHAEGRRTLKLAGTALGRAIVTWGVLFWPQRVAISGGVSLLGDLLLEPARREVKRIGPPYIVGDLEVTDAHLGRAATVIGAGLWALRKEEKAVVELS